MTTAAIHQPQYLPYLGFFHKLSHCDIFVALDNAQFQKNGLQNRNKIKTRRGWQWLTVPVIHHFGELINQVAINSDVPWQRKHWNALVTNYSGTPFFDAYSPGLKTLLLEGEFKRLCSIDMALVQWTMDVLGISAPVIYSSSLRAEGKQTDLLVNICKAIGADCYLSGPGGRRYMELAAFEAAGIAVKFQEFSSPVYAQVFPMTGFLPDLSVVDALFCCGPETIKFLE